LNPSKDNDVLSSKLKAWPVLRAHSTLSCVFGAMAACGLFPSFAMGAPEPGTIEIYEPNGIYTLAAPPPGMQPVILQVPEKFRYGSSKGSVRNWGLNILTYYPSFTSPQDPENAKFGLDCAGLCNGRVLIAVKNQARGIRVTGSPNMGDFIARNTVKWNKTPPYPSNVQVRDLEPPDGFDDGFERVTRALGNAPGGLSPNFAQVEQFYFRKAVDGIHYDLAATCRANPERTTCTLHFSLNCDPGISVSVNGLDGRYLKLAQDIKAKTDQFISRMVKAPTCGQ
jgi:hypothetical protein